MQNRNNKTNGRPIYCRGGGGDDGYLSRLKTSIIRCLSTGRLCKQCNTISEYFKGATGTRGHWYLRTTSPQFSLDVRHPVYLLTDSLLQTFRGYPGNIKGSRLFETAVVHNYTALHNMMPFAPSTTRFWVQLCQTMPLLVVHFQACWLIIAVIGLFKRPCLVVLHVSRTVEPKYCKYWPNITKVCSLVCIT